MTVGVLEESGIPACGHPPAAPADKQTESEGKEAALPRNKQRKKQRGDSKEGKEVLQDGGTTVQRYTCSEQGRENMRQGGLVGNGGGIEWTLSRSACLSGTLVNPAFASLRQCPKEPPMFQAPHFDNGIIEEEGWKSRSHR